MSLSIFVCARHSARSQANFCVHPKHIKVYSKFSYQSIHCNMPFGKDGGGGGPMRVRGSYSGGNRSSFGGSGGGGGGGRGGRGGGRGGGRDSFRDGGGGGGSRFGGGGGGGRFGGGGGGGGGRDGGRFGGKSGGRQGDRLYKPQWSTKTLQPFKK
ncbi:unnamed protein product [Callosobruchus maculatus]|uniref:Uncharacterized protein n=1 Tax=Callosobruchus maculatus TaxID=64391 RepID=A0A653CDT6_CALMS|nr:unnamed protein product [Callosobruchus maculatus]